MILLRHGESEFNRHFSVTRRDPGIRDPELTERGLAQASVAAASLAGMGISRIIVSPYTRALQTAAVLSGPTGAPTTIDPLVRERFAFICDVGSPRSVLERRWPAHDFTLLPEQWWPETAEPQAEVIARAARFRSAMAADGASEGCVVISHWGFILALTGVSIPNGAWLAFDPAAPPPSGIVWKP